MAKRARPGKAAEESAGADPPRRRRKSRSAQAASQNGADLPAPHDAASDELDDALMEEIAALLAEDDEPPLIERVEADLRQGGVLSRALPGYEERPAQIIMARRVAQALERDEHLVAEASTGTGKALDVDTPIPTPTGWKRMGDLVVGDTVFDEMGQPTQVTVAFEVMHDRPCYEVLFSDGTMLVADAEHEWVTHTCADRQAASAPQSVKPVKNFVTLGTLDALATLIVQSPPDETISASEAAVLIGGHTWTVKQAALLVGSSVTDLRPARYPRNALLAVIRSRLERDYRIQRRGGRAKTIVTTEQMAATLTIGGAGYPKRANHAIALAHPLALAEAKLPIDPYFLGAWLGDGSSRSNQITSADPEICDEIAKAGYTVRPLVSNPSLFAVDDENGKASSRWYPGMTGKLRALGLIQNKHIPAPYLRAAEQQRRALLAGLLDTDGTVNWNGAVEFTTTTAQLAEDFHELACSLGFRPTIRRGRARLYGKDCGPKWTVGFTTDIPVFRLPRKLQAQRERLRNYSPDRNRFRYVVAVNKVPTRPVRCIQVDSPNHLYLAGRSMIPTHNSLAYILPIVRSGKVALLSTANKALQEQLYFKDIPFVQANVQPFEAALVKGMGNYLCLDRLSEERAFQALARTPGFDAVEEAVEDPDWDGDLDLLPGALSGDIRPRVAADSDQCAWRACPFFNDCYVRKMRERAREAQVIVVNHTLLLLDAAMGGFLLPERDVVVIDEAHHLEEEATRAFTATVTPGRVNSLLALRRLREIAEEHVQRDVSVANGAAWEALRRVTGDMPRGRQRLDHPLEEGKRLANAVDDLAASLQRMRPLNMTEKDEQLFEKLVKRARLLASDIRAVFAVDRPDERIYYVEMVRAGRRENQQPAVSAAPLAVADLLREKLFDKVHTIATSATLAVGGDFRFFRARVGLEDAPGVTLPYAFDYATHALLYLPRLRFDPAFGAASEPYLREIGEQMRALVKESGGRAFLLFSSRRALDGVYANIGADLEDQGYATLVQGRDAGRLELLRQFREGDRAALFGLKSFWEGVDVAGEALSLVVIDKLPFDPPDDPVHEARVSRMKAAGENWFGAYVLPNAILRLKQGVGRLIRTRDDRGVMAILDRRIYTKSYGREVMLALPPARRAERIEDVRAFFAGYTPDDGDA